MCFTRIETNKIAPPEGLESFKVLRKSALGGYRSEYHRTHIEYVIGDTIHAIGTPEPSFKFFEYFKVWKIHKIKRERVLQIMNSKSHFDGEVVHSFTTKEKAMEWKIAESYFGCDNEVIIRCLIPGGTPYWENIDSGEYASFEVKLLEVIT